MSCCQPSAFALRRSLRTAWVLGLICCNGPLLSRALAAGLPLPGATAPVVANASTPDPSPEAVTARRSALKKEIAATRAALAALPEGATDEAAHGLAEETALLERIDAIHAEQQRTAQHTADLTKEAADVEERMRNRRPPEATFQPPLHLPLLDQLYDERDKLSDAVVRLKREIDGAETLAQEARTTLEEKDRARRTVRQSLESAAGGPKRGNLRLAELESRLAQETVLLREQALKTLQREQSLLAPKEKLLLPRVAWLRAHLTPAPGEAAPAPARQAQLAAALASALAEEKKTADLVTSTAIAHERRGSTEKAAEELGSRRADRLTAQLTVSVLTAQRERLAELALVTEWRKRVLLGTVPADELRKLARDNQAALDQLAGERRRKGLELFRHRQELQVWQGRFTREAAAGEKSPAWAVERVRRLAAWLELSVTEVADLDRMRTGRSRLQEEIGEHLHLFSWREAAAVAGETVSAAWNRELFSVQDQPVRVKTMLAVLVLIGLGYHASRGLSRILARTVLLRLGLSLGQRAAWQVLWFYALFAVILVVAFNLFHISLTQFSVVSGALAVGIGFGSQNLIGNFISGIILLLERPVNQGDVIEIDGRQVTVEKVGPRSTVVRSIDNTHVIVPNSRLLEQPVTNWTLSDDIVRKCIRVGVAYASPTRQVAALLQRVAAGVEGVKPEPAPMVTFADFGESALVFDVFVWVGIATGLQIETELRHRIAETLAAEKIAMAFPQRDVNLATAAPLQVAIMRAAAQPGEV